MAHPKITNKEELDLKCDAYNENISDWEFYGLAYRGGSDFIEKVLTRHERESLANWKARVSEGINFNYCQSIINLVNFYLTEKPVSRKIPRLEEDVQWKMFLSDADLYGTNFDLLMNEAQKLASVYGSIGILIDKPPHKYSTKEEEKQNRIYPYCSPYILENIYYWEYERNKETNRPELSYLKLKQNDGNFLIWTKKRWEIWEDKGKNNIPVRIKTGKNHLEEIPFVWLVNLSDLANPYIGISDIVELSRITASITRNLSCGEEVVKYAGFPIFRKPMEREDGEDGPSKETIIGPDAVTEFDPEYGKYGKPDWLESAIEAPIKGITGWVDKKIDESFRIAHLSGIHGQRKTNNEVASGLALRYEFQQLNSVLTQKSKNMSEAEMNILRFWLKWQNSEDEIDTEVDSEVKIERSTSFSIEDLSVDLKNSMEAMNAVASETFAEHVQKSIVSRVLSDIPPEIKTIIGNEIKENIENEKNGDGNGKEKKKEMDSES
ncbi:MAG: hypothetical protein AMK71_04160 [Nitrospira bacterium SG8_35_4]|nr:MAG: hypothetical protein AMK71_04160 [Nitrospira bacterium SG8_35_4]